MQNIFELSFIKPKAFRITCLCSSVNPMGVMTWLVQYLLLTFDLSSIWSPNVELTEIKEITPVTFDITDQSLKQF